MLVISVALSVIQIPFRRSSNPIVAKVGGLQSQGTEGEAVISD